MPQITTPQAPAAPSLPAAPKATAELGHGFALSVAAESTVPVTYSIKGALPKGVTLNAKTGLISGTAKESGTFAFSVTAKSAAGSDTQKYTVVVPDLVHLVTSSANWITPIQGQPFAVSIGGLQKGERWTVKANGKTVKTGTAAKGRHGHDVDHVEESVRRQGLHDPGQQFAVGHRPGEDGLGRVLGHRDHS